MSIFFQSFNPEKYQVAADKSDVIAQIYVGTLIIDHMYILRRPQILRNLPLTFVLYSASQK